MPCPPPTLHIATDSAPNKVLLHWSSAYPDYRLQSVSSLDGSGPFGFGDAATVPSLVDGKLTVTNPVSTSKQFFKLAK